MTIAAWICLLLIAGCLVWAVLEVAAARRAFRPARIGVLVAAALIMAGSTVVGLLAGLSPLGMLGMPRRYATYEPEPGPDLRVLIPALGVGLLLGALIGAVRTAAGTPVDALAAARTRNRVLAAAGLVLVVTGTAALLLR